MDCALVVATPVVDLVPESDVGETEAENGFVLIAPATWESAMGSAVGTPAFYEGPLGTYVPPRSMAPRLGAPSVA